MSNEFRLKGRASRRSGPYPLGEFPHNIAIEIGRHIVHRLAVGQTDITGDDFGEMFARAIGGLHRKSPLGIADVEWNGCAWSVKTMFDRRPFSQTRVRCISGRNSPTYSSGIKNMHEDLQATGRAILGVWNARVDEALSAHDDLRVLVLVRNLSALQFTMFEHEAHRFIASEYVWQENANGNFEGYDTATNEHLFTWQPHGSQFTVIRRVPASAYRFRIRKRPMTLGEEDVLKAVGFQDDWIEREAPAL